MSNSAGLEVANISIRKPFKDARESDVVFYTTESNQMIHIGCGVDENKIATLITASSNALFSKDVKVTGVVDAISFKQAGINLSNLYLSKAGDSMTGNLNITGILSASNIQQSGSNLLSTFINKSGDTVNGALIINGSLSASNIVEAGSNLSLLYARRTGDNINGLLTVSNLNVNGSFTRNNQQFVFGVSSCNLSQIVSMNPPTGFSSNLVTVPTLITTTVPTDTKLTYGRIELAAHNNVSLFAGASITITVQHNLGNSNYWVYTTPDQDIAIRIKVQNRTNNSFDLLVINASNSNVGPQGISYQLVQSGSSNLVTLAQPVIITSSNLTLSSQGPNFSTKIFTLNQANDPQGYAINYNFVSGSNSRTAISGSNLIYTNAGANANLNLVVKAKNSHVDDPSKIFSVILSEGIYFVTPSSPYSGPGLLAQNFRMKVVITTLGNAISSGYGSSASIIMRNPTSNITLYTFDLRDNVTDKQISQYSTNSAGVRSTTVRIGLLTGGIISGTTNTNFLQITPSTFIWTNEAGTKLHEFTNLYPELEVTNIFCSGNIQITAA